LDVTTLRYRLLPTFAGTFAILRTQQESIRTTWVDRRGAALARGREDRRLEPELARRLRAYFAGEPVRFDEWLPADGTDFLRACWAACHDIAWGGTLSYGELGRRAGAGAAAGRAVGQAMRRNPVPVIVPCHRVVGASGRLHGFAGCCDMDGPELQLKARLLAHERESA
jgi:methylated-DNA-[protein]-cysteine S-methyltransferase